MTEQSPPEIVSVEIGPNGMSTEAVALMATWPGETPMDDRASFGIANAVLLSGNPDDIVKWAIDLAMKARSAQQEMLEDRVIEGNVLAEGRGL